MTDPSPALARAGTILASVARHPLTVWIAFVAVHLWLGLLNLFAPGLPLGDVTLVYTFWMDQARIGGYWVGIDTAWVYPILALVPMILASAFGNDQIAATWLTMIMLLNAVAFGVLTGWGRSRERVPAAWWWVAFLVALGPIALGRIDSVTVPLAIIGVLLLSRTPRIAGAVLAIATWVKVWPAVLLAAAVIALRARVRILISAVIVSVAVITVALVLGAGGNVFSFITEQTGRGLQIEAPVSTIWLWMTAAGVPGTRVYYDSQILTYQVDGPGSAAAAALMTPLLVLAVLAILLLGIRAARRHVAPGDLLPPLALALVAALIGFNKVGSPQFMTWLAVPILLGLVTHAAGHGGSFRTPATLAIVMAGLTQLIYPTFYGMLLTVEPLMLGVITVRNVLTFVLLGWAVMALVRAPSTVVSGEEPDEDWLPSVWPFAREEDAVDASRAP